MSWTAIWHELLPAPGLAAHGWHRHEMVYGVAAAAIAVPASAGLPLTAGASAFLLNAWLYAPIRVGPRVDGRAG